MSTKTERASKHGERVIGADAHAQAVEAQEGGLEVFGKRVVGPSGLGATADQIAKGASQFGVRVTADAKFQDHEGSESDGVAVDALENILEENPTTFDSLYEAELAREGGARKDALNVFKVVEQGIKGAGRQHVIDEINALLGVNQVTAKQRANESRIQAEELRRRQARMDENALLDDAARVRALKERQENLAAISKGGAKSTSEQLTVQSASLDTAAQQRAIAKDLGIEDVPAGAEEAPTSGRGPHASLAKDDVKPETQRATPRASQKK